MLQGNSSAIINKHTRSNPVDKERTQVCCRERLTEILYKVSQTQSCQKEAWENTRDDTHTEQAKIVQSDIAGLQLRMVYVSSLPSSAAYVQSGELGVWRKMRRCKLARS